MSEKLSTGGRAASAPRPLATGGAIASAPRPTLAVGAAALVTRAVGVAGAIGLAVSVSALAVGASLAPGASPAAGAADASAAHPVHPADAQVALVTGSTGGLGREVALRLASSGAHLIIHGRNRERGEEVVAEAERLGAASARFYQADFASLDETRRLAREILRDYDRLDLLVNNAGVWLDGPEQREMTDDGMELHFQVNYLAGAVLTRMLLPLMERSAPARIVNVASSAQRPIDFDDVMMDEGYSHSRGYAQSKLAQVVFTMDLARELEGTGITVHALHPATFMDTNMVLSRGARPRSSVDDGADAVMHVITADVGTGRYFTGTRETQANQQAYDREAQEALRRLTQALGGS